MASLPHNAVLGSADFGGIHVGHDFDSRHHRLFDVIRDVHYLLEFTVHSTISPAASVTGCLR